MNIPRPDGAARVLAAALMFSIPRVCVGDSAADDSQAQSVTAGVHSNLQGVVAAVSNGQVAAIYGEQSSAAALSVGTPAGTRATTNGAAIPDAQLPQEFRAPAAAPPAPSAAAPTDVVSTIRSWLHASLPSWSPPPAPPSTPVRNPSFGDTSCAPGQADCVGVMTLKENSPAGLRDVPITDFVDYGTVHYDGRPDNQIWDRRPWWKFWLDPRQVDSADIQQGGLGDCFLLASLASLAQNKPEILRDMIKQDRNGSPWVRFYGGKPLKQTLVGPIDESFPVYKPKTEIGTAEVGGQSVFAAPAGSQGAMWPLIIEKSYTMLFGSGSYAEVNEGGRAGDALAHFIGRRSRVIISERPFSPFTTESSHYESGPVFFPRSRAGIPTTIPSSWPPSTPPKAVARRTPCRINPPARRPELRPRRLSATPSAPTRSIRARSPVCPTRKIPCAPILQKSSNWRCRITTGSKRSTRTRRRSRWQIPGAPTCPPSLGLGRGWRNRCPSS